AILAGPSAGPVHGSQGRPAFDQSLPHCLLVRGSCGRRTDRTKCTGGMPPSRLQSAISLGDESITFILTAMLINIFDTAIESDNLGDHIIMDAVWDVVRPLFPGATFIRTPSHRRATFAELCLGRKAALSIVGGTNILKSHMLVRSN